MHTLLPWSLPLTTASTFNHTPFLLSHTATVDVRRVVSSLAINTSDTQVAVVETESGDEDLMEDSVVRVYEIGMSRQADEEMVSEIVVPVIVVL